MQALQKLKETMKGVGTAAGRRVENLREGRRRKQLLSELGELFHRKHKGDPIDATAIDPVLAEIDRIDAAETDTAANEADTPDGSA